MAVRRGKATLVTIALVFAFVSAGTPITAEEPGTSQASGRIGAAITPDFAKELYEKIAPMREADGCHLARFDTVRFSITIGLETPTGSQLAFILASADYTPDVERTAGGWALDVPASLDTECGATMAAIERALAGTATPRGAPWRADRWTSVRANYALLAACFVALLAWSCLILYRQAREHSPPRYALVSLALIWLAALALRLFLSPHTFLHEYYHIAETLYGHLMGETGPVYGDTGPALFQLFGRLSGQPDDARVIFMTNALIASLAIPAVALFDLAMTRSWPRALCAAALLACLPHHLRFSASEVLFVQSVTFGMWTLALFALYLRTLNIGHALCAVLALSLAMQTRPEMLLFPAALAGLVVLTEPGSWRVLFHRYTMSALLVLLVLLVPRFFELRQVMNGASQAGPVLPELHRYWSSLILLDPELTPQTVLAWVAVGWLATLWHKPGYAIWAVLVYIGFTLFSLSLFDNPPYNVRSQLLPTCFAAVAGAGVASIWMALWNRRRPLGLAVGACLLVGSAVFVVTRSYAFITELRDQQLEWRFLDRTVPLLPTDATLLSVAEVGGRNLDAFPEFLLRKADKNYVLVDLRNAIDGKVGWPEPSPRPSAELLFYQGMFCYFAFPDQPPPHPMTEICRAVHDRYATEPLIVEDLDTTGYSAMSYAESPYRIGFYRLRRRASEAAPDGP